MSKKAWLILIFAFESTWFVYMALLMPVVARVVMQGPDAQLTASLIRLSYILPLAGAVTILALIAGIFDIRQRNVASKPAWILGFAFFGVVVFPLYFVFHVWAPTRSAA